MPVLSRSNATGADHLPWYDPGSICRCGHLLHDKAGQSPMWPTVNESWSNATTVNVVCILLNNSVSDWATRNIFWFACCRARPTRRSASPSMPPVNTILNRFQGHPAGDGPAPVPAQSIGNSEDIPRSRLSIVFGFNRMGDPVGILILRAQQSLMSDCPPLHNSADKSLAFCLLPASGNFLPP